LFREEHEHSLENNVAGVVWSGVNILDNGLATGG
jgi:hypothetical protein